MTTAALPYQLGPFKLHSRLWACVAQDFHQGSRVIGIETAMSVQRAAKSDVIIANCRRVSPSEPDSPECWSMDEFLRRLGGGARVVAVNTSRARSADEAVMLARVGLLLYPGAVVKLELLDGDLAPMVSETLQALEALREGDGANVVPLLPCDRSACSRALALGAVGLRVRCSAIGSNAGIERPAEFAEICRAFHAPVIAECGIGTPDQAEAAMMLGATAVLVNSAIVRSPGPAALAAALRQAVDRGWLRAGGDR